MEQEQTGRARLVFAGVASALLVGIMLVVVLSGGDEAKDVSAECLDAWNEDTLALSDGVHAYAAHGYRETLLARVDEQGDIQADADEQEGRCVVIFAAPNVTFEPGFGVRVLEAARWIGLAAADQIPVDDIPAMQNEATATTNTILLPDGRLTQG